jgi:gamma-glutamyltranspeptidase / glutathione hydrolase
MRTSSKCPPTLKEELKIGAQIETGRLVPPGCYTSQTIECSHGVVVSISRAASDAGVSILKRGGNAVDAAVATAFALGVTYPAAGNIGGGGFMLVHPAPDDGLPVVFDYRETAPAAAWPTMYPKEESQHTHRSVAIPGNVRGLALAHRRFGKLPWAELLSPSVTLARNGFLLQKFLAAMLNEVLAAAPEKAEFQRVFGKPGGGMWQEGDRLVQPDLARTLQCIADSGPDAFYDGPIGPEIVAEMGRANGLLRARDLANYRAVERTPLSARYRGFDVYVPPAPSSGGVCLVQELNILRHFDVNAYGRWSATLLHVMAEAMRRSNYDRARYLGDPAFVQIPPELTTLEYGQTLAATIDLHHATPSVEISTQIPVSAEAQDTTHLSVIDSNGMAVSNTYSLERIWGSRIVVKGTGILLNNMMRAFNLFPGRTDTSGTIGTAANVIAPGKRPISSMSPTIVAKDGRVVLVTGAPGSRAIPHTILGIILSVIDFEMPAKDAVESPRISHQWFPDRITFEAPERFPKAVKRLKEMGHSVIRTGPLPQGDAHTIFASESKGYVGVTDSRRNPQASPAGY